MTRPDGSSVSKLWLVLQRLANREQEDGTLVFRVWRKELNHVIVEEGQAGRTEVLGIRRQIQPAADGACLQMSGAALRA